MWVVAPLFASTSLVTVTMTDATNEITNTPVHGNVVVYGASGAACTASIAASRSGASNVILLSQTSHVGGMLTGGLQHTDSANDTVIQGITREFFVRTEEHYPGRPTGADYPPGHNPPGWLFESHVGEHVLDVMLEEANVTVVKSVGGVVDVSKQGTVIQTVTFENNATYSADVWIDASYEGGIGEKVATMTFGREGKEVYNETAAGVGTLALVASDVSPYWDPTADPYDTPANVIPHVSPAVPGQVGEGDWWTEPYDFRLCFTNSPGNKLNFTKPDGYNASEFEFWRRLYAVHPPSSLGNAGLSCLGPIPNNYSDCGTEACKKCDMLGMNHGTDMTDGSWGYPNGTLEERKAIWQAHVHFTQSLLWFWMSDPSVPDKVKHELASYGHCTDEYLDTTPPHWPHQLYVREAKRLVGDFVWTEWRPNATIQNRSVGLGSYNFDSHYVSRIIRRTGTAANDNIAREGRVKVQTEQGAGPSPAPPSGGLGYGCVSVGEHPHPTQQMCIAGVGGKSGNDSSCGGGCGALQANDWLAVTKLSKLSNNNQTLTVTLPKGQNSSWLKKSEDLAKTLPPSLKQEIVDGQVLQLAHPADTYVGAEETYYLITLAGEEDSSHCGVCMVEPFIMPYDAMLPKATEATNLLSPVAVSASHVRYNAVRMEPTWMILGHSAGTAAALAVEASSTVQSVDVGALQAKLLAQKQLLSPTAPLP